MSYQGPRGKQKPPVPRYHYKLATVLSSGEACWFENALRERLRDSGLTFFAICHENGDYDVMGDSGAAPLGADGLRAAGAAAARIEAARKLDAKGARRRSA